MNQVLSEEYKVFRDSVRRFVDREILPRKREIAEAEKISLELWKKICDLGVMEAVDPGVEGGQRGDLIALGVAAEEIARGDVSLALTVIPNVGFCFISQFAAQDIRKEWVSSIISGKKLACFAVTEDHCGTDLHAIETIAHREKGSYIVNGQKTPIRWGMHADVAVVLAKVAPSGHHKGLACITLPLDIEGVTKSPLLGMGLAPTGIAELGFKDTRIPCHYLIGEEGRGDEILMGAMDIMRVLSSLVSIGAAKSIIDETVKYVKQRVAFGKPIGRFEGVSFRIVEAVTLLEAGRGLCYKALMLRNQQGHCRKESAMCKWWATKVAVDIVHDALILHGYSGYTSEGNIERCLRDLMGIQVADGSPGAMKLALVGELLGKEFPPYCEEKEY